MLEAQQYDEEGRPLRPLVSADAWARPLRVEVRDGLLWPRHSAHEKRGPMARPGPGMLTGFLALAGADDAAYARYAKRWGMLGLCGCDLPHQHGYTDPVPGSVCIERPDGVPDGHDEFPERISAWRHFVDQAVEIVTATQRARPLGQRDPVEQINEWIDMGRVGLTVSRREGPRLHLGSGFLFGALAVAMLSLVMGGERLAVCAGCGRWFSPAQRQVTGRLWCTRDACQRAKRAAASRDYRLRRREDPMRVLGIRGAWVVRSRTRGS